MFLFTIITGMLVHADLIYNEGFAVAEQPSALSAVGWEVYDANGTDWSDVAANPSRIISDGAAPDGDGCRLYMGGGTADALALISTAPPIAACQRDNDLRLSLYHRDTDEDGNGRLRFLLKVGGIWYASGKRVTYTSGFQFLEYSVESLLWYEWKSDLTAGFALSEISNSGSPLPSGDITSVGLLLTNPQTVDSYRIDAFKVSGRAPLSGLKVHLLPEAQHGASSALGYYGTCPESPSGNRLAFVTYGNPGKLWVCDRDDLQNVTELHDLDVNAHDGAKQLWMDNVTLAFSDSYGEMVVMNVETGQILKENFYGQIGHNSVSGQLPFMVNAAEKNKRQTLAGETVEQGVYLWDLATDTWTQVCTSSNLASQLAAEGASDVAAEPKLYHAMLSPNGSQIAVRWDGTVETHLAIISTNGTLVSAYPDPKPLHFLWYDDSSVMGVETYTNSNENGYYKRWNLAGTEIETLAGVMTHAAVSPSNGYYAGETADYYQSPISLALFQKGETVPDQIFWQHSFTNTVWYEKFHVNPSFSRDGERLYFNYAVSDSRSRAAYCVVAADEWVWADNESAGTIALNTVDGDLTTRWSISVTNTSIYYDLGGSCTVGSAAIAWGYNNQYQFDIGTAQSLSGTWTTVYSGSSAGIGQVFEEYSFASIAARYVRVTVYGRTGSSWTHVAEVMLFE